jgi:hypothetical protein
MALKDKINSIAKGIVTGRASDIVKKIHFDTKPLFFSMKHVAWQLQI